MRTMQEVISATLVPITHYLSDGEFRFGNSRCAGFETTSPVIIQFDDIKKIRYENYK